MAEPIAYLANDSLALYIIVVSVIGRLRHQEKNAARHLAHRHDYHGARVGLLRRLGSP